MRYKIVTDSGMNFRGKQEKADFASVPLKINTAERQFVDQEDLDLEEMLTYLRNYKGKSGTACPSVAEWIQAFGDGERIFCLTITSNLSGSYNSARLAKEDYEGEYPDRKVYLIDSLSAGPEMELIMEKIIWYLEQGKEYEEIIELISEYQQKTGLLFALESLKNLANNGRVNPAVAKLSGVLGIRVIGRASEKGDLESLDKCRGDQKTLSLLLEYLKKFGYKGGRLMIDHCENPQMAEQLKNKILEIYPRASIKIGITYGLCSFYAEKGGMMLGFEKETHEEER